MEEVEQRPVGESALEDRPWPGEGPTGPVGRDLGTEAEYKEMVAPAELADDVEVCPELWEKAAGEIAEVLSDHCTALQSGAAGW